jgi:hypothetical protein
MTLRKRQDWKMQQYITMCVENSLWKRLWTCRKTLQNEWISHPPSLPLSYATYLNSLTFVTLIIHKYELYNAYLQYFTSSLCYFYTCCIVEYVTVLCWITDRSVRSCCQPGLSVCTNGSQGQQGCIQWRFVHGIRKRKRSIRALRANLYKLTLNVT